MSELVQTASTPEALRTLMQCDVTVATLEQSQVAGFASRLQAITTPTQRRIDAWAVEQGGVASTAFSWRAATARRLLGTAAAHRAVRGASILQSVHDEVGDNLIRATRGEARFGSLGQWLSSLTQAELGMVIAEAVNWASTLLDTADLLGPDAELARADYYFNVAGAQTTLRGPRDVIVGEIVVRVRSGAPGKSAGAGLRADLFIATVAAPTRQAPRHFIGLWPDAGVALAVEGTMENLRAGARDIVRVATHMRRYQPAKVA